jgi:hypothetical protein
MITKPVKDKVLSQITGTRIAAPSFGVIGRGLAPRRGRRRGAPRTSRPRIIVREFEQRAAAFSLRAIRYKCGGGMRQGDKVAALAVRATVGLSV